MTSRLSSSEGTLPFLKLVCLGKSPSPTSSAEEIKATFALGPKLGPCLSFFLLHGDSKHQLRCTVHVKHFPIHYLIRFSC